MSVVINTPASLTLYREHIKEFVVGMISKLDINSHKNTPTTDDISTIVSKLKREVAEFEEQFSKDMKDENSLMELMDVSNFALLAFIALRNKGVKTPKENMIDELFDINCEKGTVHCKKVRVGSRYKIGDEVGSLRKSSGYVKITLQRNKYGGVSGNMPRSHIIWYGAYGKWPIGVIDHINGIKDDDRLENLRDVSHVENSINRKKSSGLPPYVRKAKDKNKYSYQRSYRGVNISTRHFCSIEEALTTGQEEWVKRTKEMDNVKDN